MIQYTYHIEAYWGMNQLYPIPINIILSNAKWGQGLAGTVNCFDKSHIILKEFIMTPGHYLHYITTY